MNIGIVNLVVLVENDDGLLEQFIVDGDVGYVWGVVVVQSVDVLHHLSRVRLDRSQNQQVLQVSEIKLNI